MLWGRSRAIEFIGQTGTSVVVDGYTYLPSTFTVHDYVHAMVRRFTTAESIVYWDNIEAYLDRSELSKREIKLIEALLFLIHHEFNHPMSCYSTPRPTDPLEEVVKRKYQTVMDRLNDKNDLGQAFNGRITKDEIHSAYLFMHKMMLQVCIFGI